MYWAHLAERQVRTTRQAVIGTVDSDGWYHTGDLGRWAKPTHEGADQRIVIVDRIAFTIKLANGEFVSLQRLEAFF